MTTDPQEQLIDLLVNNERRSLSAPFTLERLAKEYGLQSATGIAVAVNDQVVGRNSWAEFELKSADTVLIITATQGG